MGGKNSKNKNSDNTKPTPIVHDQNFLKTIGLGKGDIPSLEQIAKIWAFYDKNKDGSLTRAEFESYFQDFCGQMEVQIPNWKEEAGKMFDALDTNKDGSVSSDEFKKYFEPKADESDLKGNE